MEDRRSQFVLRLLPSFADFAFLMPILFLFGRMDGVKTLLGDGDTGWHIRAGEWILAHGRVPARDIFSFSMPDRPWFAWEWLSEVLMARLNALGGLAAISLFSILLLCVTFTLLFLETRRKANSVVAVALTMLAAAASTVHWLARPHLFTLLFLILFYRALESRRAGRTGFAGIPYAALLPAATILWTNLHGGFFVGILMIGAYGAGEALTLVFSAVPERRAAAAGKPRFYFLIALGCAAASFVNPYTYHLHVHTLQYLRDPWNARHVMEFLSPSFHAPNALFFEMLLGAGVVAAWWHATQGRYTEAILVAVWAHGGLLAGRNIPIFAILAAPTSAAAIQHGLSRAHEWRVAEWLRVAVARFNQAAAGADEKESIQRLRLASVLGAALVAAILFAPHPPASFRAEFSPKDYPAAALARMNFGPSTRIFTHDEWGDYLIWKLYPRGNRVFVDGRSDFYGGDFESKYLDLLNARWGWEQTLARFGVDTVLMPPDTAITAALKESSRWKLVYDDGISVVFRSVAGTAGETFSAADGGGLSRGREATKTETGDLTIAHTKSKT